jgi:hypothetical protein
MFNGESIFAPPNFFAGVMPEDWNNSCENLVLCMYSEGNPRRYLLAQFHIGMNVFLEELKDRGIIAQPLRETSIWYNRAKVWDECYYVPSMGLLSLAAIMPVVLYFVFVTRKRKATKIDDAAERQ